MTEELPGWEAKTHSLESAHYRVHQGFMFSFGDFNPVVAAAGVVEVLIRTGNIPPHTIFGVTAGADAIGELFEGAVVTVDGTPLLVHNHNRPKAANVSLTTAFDGPTITDDGVEVTPGIFIPGGSQGQTVGGAGDFGRERILLPNTNYLGRVTNLSNGDAPISFTVQFYEPRR